MLLYVFINKNRMNTFRISCDFMLVIRIGFEPMTYCLEETCPFLAFFETLVCSGF